MIDPKNYIRLFQVKAPNQIFFLDCALEAYQALDGLIVIKDSEFTFYLTKDTIAKTTKAGHELYEHDSSFSEYERNFSEFLDGSIGFYDRLLSKSSIETDDVRLLVEFTKTFFSNYSKTEFFYTDDVYRKAKEDGDQATLDRLQRLDALKFKGREAMNKLFFLQGNVIAHVSDKIGETYGVSGDLVRCSTIAEILGLLEGKALSEATKRRNEYSVLFAEGGKRFPLDEAEEKRIVEAFASVSSDTQIRGKIACKGKVRGIVKVFPPNYGEMEKLMAEVDKMEKGQIMVAETTSPDIVAACRKAAAIVTNQGGMMSHAAVVARELNIPCIVGTGNATKVLKDGDLVEVDADNGIVTILS